MDQPQSERLDRVLSTLAALGAFGFFISSLIYGWAHAFTAVSG